MSELLLTANCFPTKIPTKISHPNPPNAMKKANKIQATVTSTMLTQLSTGRFPALQTKIVAYVTKKEATKAKWFKIFKINSNKKLLKLKNGRKPLQAAEETKQVQPGDMYMDPISLKLADIIYDKEEKNATVDYLYPLTKEVVDQQIQLEEPKCECPTDATPENKEFCEMKKRQINFQYPAKFGNRKLADLPDISGKEDCFKSNNHPLS